MKLYILRAIGMDDMSGDYDCLHGAVVRAESETDARRMTQSIGGIETSEWPQGATRAREKPFWTDPALVTCDELLADGEAGVVIRDFLSG